MSTTQQPELPVAIPSITAAALNPRLGMGNPHYYSGVIEGFYGRPWSGLQRRQLLKRLAKYGCNTYVYAPKDDPLHRARWRELYPREEADQLRSLIKYSQDIGIDFVYALSPGGDIIYSKNSDVDGIKQKLDQLRSVGCRSFALFFDDIDVILDADDRAAFGSAGAAQVSVTNDVYAYLGSPATFFFCPTEYCTNRALPDIAHSDYLITVGDRLHPSIQIFWTGARVVPEHITAEHAKEVAQALKRKVVIWDNQHANDYDITRLVLGPFTGRSVAVYGETNGLLLNPNVQFEANFIPIDTFFTWLRASRDSQNGQATNDFWADNSAFPTPPSQLSDSGSGGVYDPTQAFEESLARWLPDFNLGQELMSGGGSIAEAGAGPSSAFADNARWRDMRSQQASNGEGASANHSETAMEEEDNGRGQHETADESMDEGDVDMAELAEETRALLMPERWLTIDELRTLVHCYYNPYEHGPEADQMMDTIATLIRDANVMFRAHLPLTPPDLGQAGISNDDLVRESWKARAEEFRCIANRIFSVFRYFSKNKALQVSTLATELLGYIWELYSVLTVILGVVDFIKDRREATRHNTPSFQEAEPWMREGEGNENADPTQSSFKSINSDLFYLIVPGRSPLIQLYKNKTPSLPLRYVDFSIRPIVSLQDMNLLDNLEWTTRHENGAPFEPAPWQEMQQFRFHDRYTRPFLEFDNASNFIAVDSAPNSPRQVLCAILGVFHVQPFRRYMAESYLPCITEYQKSRAVAAGCSPEMVAGVEADIRSWMPPLCRLPIQYHSYFDLRCVGDEMDAHIGKRLIQTLGTVLAHQGSMGMYTVVRKDERRKFALFTALRFAQLDHTENAWIFGFPLRMVGSPNPSLADVDPEGVLPDSDSEADFPLMGMPGDLDTSDSEDDIDERRGHEERQGV